MRRPWIGIMEGTISALVSPLLVMLVLYIVPTKTYVGFCTVAAVAGVALTRPRFRASGVGLVVGDFLFLAALILVSGNVQFLLLEAST